jgi:hypothetical protein
MRIKVVGRNLTLATAFLSVAHFCYGQAVGPTVEVPTERTALIDLSSTPNNDVTVASEYKSTKNVVEQEKPVFWNWYAEFGYESEYNFRGTNLLPDSDGAVFLDLEVSKWGFTLGMYDVHQLGTAHANTWAIAEGGGGGGGHSSFFIGPFLPETFQTYFNEIDVFLQYHHEFGPIDVTVGNIGFFIDRQSQTFVDLPADFVLFPPPIGLVNFSGIYGPYGTIENECFDRVFVRLATSVIPHIQPWITYYQTIYTWGQDPFHHEAPRIPPAPFDNMVFYNIHERDNELGGYLEGRLRGNFPIGQWLDFNPYAVISYSFHDRTEPVSNPVEFKDVVRGHSLVGWNHAQVGVEVPIHVLHFAGTSDGQWAPPDVRVNLVPFGAYSHHISTPPVGTDRDEWWGGVKLAVTF